MNWSAHKKSAAFVLAISLCCVLQPAQAQPFRDIKLAPIPDEAASPEVLRRDAHEIAQLLRIEPMVQELREYKLARAANPAYAPSKRILTQKLMCLWQIQMALETVRKLVGSINNDIARSYWSLDSLTARSAKTSNLSNTANFLQLNTQLILKQALRLDGGPLQATQSLTISASGLGVILPTVSLLAPRIFSRNFEPPPTTLSHILSPTYRPADADTNPVWRYFNSPIPGSSVALTRRQILIKHWEDWLDLNTRNHVRLKQLTGLPEGEENLVERIDILQERIALLRDFQSHVEEFDSGLHQLHKSIETD